MDPITIKVTDDIALDAGTVEETDEGFTVYPPPIPMLDQLLARLDEMPERDGDFQIQHQGVAFTALCVRWGSYLATLMDPATALHPVIPGFHKQQPEEYSFINDDEMQRLNIEISYNVYRLVQVFRARESIGLTKLIWKAYAYLPMSHKHIPKNVRETKTIYAGVIAGMHTTRSSGPEQDNGATHAGGNGKNTSKRQRIARADADRFLANALTCQSWRATFIEDIHAGVKPPQGLRPHQQRFTRSAQLALLREVTANFGGILYAMSMLFDERYHSQSIVPWPETATAIANSVYSWASWDWSLVDTSSVVELDK